MIQAHKLDSEESYARQSRDEYWSKFPKDDAFTIRRKLYTKLGPSIMIPSIMIHPPDTTQQNNKRNLEVWAGIQTTYPDSRISVAPLFSYSDFLEKEFRKKDRSDKIMSVQNPDCPTHLGFWLNRGTRMSACFLCMRPHILCMESFNSKDH